MKKTLCGWLLAACCAVPAAHAGNGVDVLAQPAVHGPQALHAVLQDVARAGERLVAVGERGVVLLSDDSGMTWRQATAVPVSVGLTAVQFIDARTGWAVGHAGVVLRSDDGGEHWTLQLDGKRAAALEQRAAEASDDAARVASAQRLVADGADKPLLALSFADARHGLVVGAYGLALSTADGGRSWQSAMERLPNRRGLHLYALARRGSDLYVAGEQGLLLRSRDDGAHFDALQGPYDGSYFAAAVLPGGRLLVGGLRGTLFASDDAGESFQPLANPIPASINGIRVADGQLLLASQAGMLLRSGLDHFAVQALPVSDGLPLTAAITAADGATVAVGMAGARRLTPSSQPSRAD
ncbi:YCF48-related protein [Pseudomonas sp. ZM23]|uniref:YCF48-related protein n=1 Tax=Pseudomonas triclosanedens TaxID=2961893 RepID=A0ABY6ZSE5_9PSED|nr:YCF48-related protein [Pseudomonas triclosanedens]MCP8467546.1 YCF48-related protein [Pseudomonas triclosanedens]MCP8471723.1 YCF48-related protein [Pseudomonas triclosanedens]MCP8478924.1 YCF48-related protein [Pseudomonas triclosanedens]WAI46990.1 YCF48-related protein [Pseudomonas triclosanedens]